MQAISFNREKPLYYVLFFFILIKYLTPEYVMQCIESFISVNYVITLAAVGLMCLLFVLKYRVLKPSVLLIVAIYLWLVLATLLNGGNVVIAALHGIQVILLCILVDTVIGNGKLLEPFLTVVRDITLLYFLSNIVVMILLPDGIPSISEGKPIPWYLYGNVNTVIKYVFPGLYCSLVLDSRKNKVASIPSVFLMAGVIVTALTVYFSATAVIGDLIIILWILGRRWLENRSWKIYAIILGLVLIVEYVVVLGHGGSSILLIVSSVFHKSITLSGRTPLWERAHLAFLKQPVFGYGLKAAADLEKAIGNNYGCHNYYLDMMYQRGIVGFGLLLGLFITPAVRGWNRDKLSRPMYLLIGMCIACVVMMLTEPFYDSEYFFIPMFYVLFSHFSKSNVKLAVRVPRP